MSSSMPTPPRGHGEPRSASALDVVTASQSRRRVVWTAIGLVLLCGLAPRLASASDPGLADVSDVLRGRRHLLLADDLVVTNSSWISTLNTDALVDVLYTSDGRVATEATFEVRNATCGVDVADQGANKPFPQQTRTARFVERDHDVVVSAFASNLAYGEGCLGSPNLQIKVNDPRANELVASGTYTLATLDYLVSAVADFDDDGLDDVLVMNGDKAFVVSYPWEGTTQLRNGPFTSTGAARTPMGEPVTGDFNADGLIDVAWPAAAVNSGSPEGSVIEVRFATVCPGSVSGTVCAGRSRFEIVLDPLASAAIQPQSTAIAYETTVPCDWNTSGTAVTTVYPLVALAAGNFNGTDRDSLLVAYARVNTGNCHTGAGVRANSYTFDDDMKPISMSSTSLGAAEYNAPIAGLYATAARLNWFGNVDQAVVAWGVAGSKVSGSVYKQSDTHVSAITFDGSLAMTPHTTERTIDGRTDTVAVIRGLAVGRFDELPDGASASDFNPQIAVLLMPTSASAACTSSSGAHTSYVDLFSLDAFNNNYTPSLATTYRPCLGYNPTTSVYDGGQLNAAFRGWHTAGSLLRAGDLQGRSVRVGPPYVLRESSHTQPFVILGAPPSHVDFVQAANETSDGPAVVNFSALPPTFFSRFSTETQGSSQSTNTQTTSYSHAKQNSDSVGVRLSGIPVVSSVVGSTSATTEKTYENVVSSEYDTYSNSSFDISTGTEADDIVWFTSTGFNAFYYPVLGQGVCADDTASCDPSAKVPLLMTFSGPEETRTVSIAGSLIEWYQPVEEPLQIFSYPWDEQQLEMRVPDLDILSRPLAFYTDSADVTETLQWSESQGNTTTTSATSTQSRDTSRAITAGSVDLTYAEGSAATTNVAVSYANSTSLSTLNSNITIAGGSSGVDIEKPGTFADPGLYTYLVAPYILGETPSTSTLQEIQTGTDLTTGGTLQVAYIADPTDSNAGSWWTGGAYSRNFDIALNRPARWDLVPTSPSSAQGPECLLDNTNGFAVTCARPNDPDTSDIWNSEFYWMRGLMVTVGGSTGPQRTQATAGERVYVTARVYNYSLKSMPSGSSVHVRFYRQPWDTGTNEALGNSVMIAENVLDPISPFHSSQNPTAPNWVLTTSSFDSTGLGGTSMIFWVVVWAEDSSGNLLGELPGHGLASKPANLSSIADVPLEEVSYSYERRPVTSTFSNNTGFLRLPFYVAPAASTRARRPGIDLSRPLAKLRLESRRPLLRAAKGEKIALEAHLRADDADRDGVLVVFYDGDPDDGARAIDAELLGHVEAGRPRHVAVPFRARQCGEHDIVVVANEGKRDEARAHISLTATCDEVAPTPTPTARQTPAASPTGSSTPSPDSGDGGCSITRSRRAATPYALAIPLVLLGLLRASGRSRRGRVLPRRSATRRWAGVISLASALILGLCQRDAFASDAVEARSIDDSGAQDAGAADVDSPFDVAENALSDSGGSSPSNAGNYGHDATFAVNPRTAELTFDAELVGLPGITDDIGVSLGLSYSSAEAVSDYESNTRFFGLPFGWKYNLSFIADTGTYKQIHIDGAQTYILDSGWRTMFRAAGSTTAQPVATGLLQYNRADMNLRSDAGTVTVNGITSAYRLSTLEGRTRYFSAAGLLLQDQDRFGNKVQYRYSGNTSPQSARLVSILDSWGHTTTFSYCNGNGCEPGQVTITLPDGRTTSFVAPDTARVTKITDTAGMVTSLSWGGKPCARGQNTLIGMTSATGGSMAVDYTCMQVCTQRSSSSCASAGATTTWPIVKRLYSCPNNASGATCPAGSPNNDYLVTEYTLGSQASPNNYTGFPHYSPYAPDDAQSDSLMSSNDHTFTYVSVVAQKRADGSVAYQTESTYSFLHLLMEEAVSVRAGQPGGGFGLSLSKETSYCYGLSSSAPTTGCPTPQVSYQSLPANYQSVVASGSCVYGVDDASPDGSARVSVVTNAYDGFGQTTNSRRYFGTTTSAVTGSCDRAKRLDHTRLQLVHDDYMAYDTPSTVDSSQHLSLGAGSGHYGVIKAHQTFSFTEPVEDDVHGSVPSNAPILVQLTCSALDSSGLVVRQATSGLLSASSAAPSTPGLITACDSPTFDLSVAPPKTSEFTYDAVGRLLSHMTRWADGVAPPMGSTATTVDTFTYTRSAPQAGEESCGSSSNDVLETTLTDGQGNTTTSRVCTLNSFPLSTRDALGRVTTYRHDLQGMTTLITHPNGTSVSHEYYYACPAAPPQAGSTATCPPGASIRANCPYDDHNPKRGCVVQKLLAGSNPDTGQANQSYVDGVMQVSIKDGLGRVVEMRDNLGGTVNQGYSALQTRATTVFDDLGRTVRSDSRIGATAPLIYSTTTTYDAKLRPSLVCGPHGVAQQIAYDDVSQQTLRLHNGTQRQQSMSNDGQQDVTTVDCPIAATQTTSAGDCPTVAAHTDTASCSGNGYYSFTLHDGAGLEHSRVAGGGNDANSSVGMIQGLPKYSADMLMYGYSAISTASGSGESTAVSTTSSWVRDIQGLPLRMGMSVTDPSNSTTNFSSDAYTYNNIGQTLSEKNKLSDDGGVTLAETYGYNANRLPTSVTNYAGVTFRTFYDNMDRKTRFCHPADGGGSEGETMTYDPIAGTLLTITHFTNSSGCDVCDGGACPGDVATDSISYTYTRFGQIASKTYSDGTRLNWAYDEYQRPSCFADAVATDAGHDCPASPTPANFAPSADQLLTWYTYWPDGDTYRRGLPKSTCRGVHDGNGGYLLKCLDSDYYTSVDSGGSCDSTLSSVTGAFAGMAKSTALCTGGSCLDGAGSLVYRTTHLYDAHGRSCSVDTRNSQDNLILGQTYEYDQYNNVVRETSDSELDATTDVNYRTTYTYDGLMRLVSESRRDVADNLIDSTKYTYDAASNVIRKEQDIPDRPGPLPTQTNTPSTMPTSIGGEHTPTPTPSIPPTATHTAVAPTATLTPKQSSDSGCTMSPRDGRRGGVMSLFGIMAVALLARPRQLHRFVGRRLLVLTLALLGMAGCGDSDSDATLEATNTPTVATSTPTVPMPTPTSTRNTIPGPGPQCSANTDSCSLSRTKLFAIAHSYNDPETTVLYRVTVPPWRTGGEFGDGVNGFFYQVVVDGHTTETRTYVPFNGIGVASDDSPQLPQFRFIVPVDVTNGPTNTSITISACATNYAVAGGTTPPCTTTLWSNSYQPLPMPTVGPPPFSNLDMDFVRNNSLTIPNSGVYPGQLTLSASGLSTSADAEWFDNHLVFFDDCLEPYTNDIFDDRTHRSIGVLAIDEALHLNQAGTAYVSKYGDLNEVTPATFPNKQYFFYTLDQQDNTQIDVGVQLLYDQSTDCPGYINNTGSSASTCGGFFAAAKAAPRSTGCQNLPSVNPQASIVPQPPNQSAPVPPSLSTQTLAGAQETRTLYFQFGNGVCSRPVNPLAGQNGRPNYVIRQSSASGGNSWAKNFSNGLYYVVPSGFGTCDLRQAAPFCDLTTNYTAYVPQYAGTDGSFGDLNGGSTPAPVIGSMQLSDEYQLPGVAGSANNSLIWFDNCGSGYIYEECSSCQQHLGSRKELPTPPDGYYVTNHQVTNELDGAIVLSKECCASYYQENQNTNPVTYEPPQSINHGYGAFVAPGHTLDYSTLFNAETWVVYNATTGGKRFKLRVSPGNSHVYSCGPDGGAATVDGDLVTLSEPGKGTLECGRIGACPFGLSATQTGETVVCQATTSDYAMGMEEWSEEVGDVTDVVRLQAWGAAGAKPGSSGGLAGAGGFAATALAPGDLASDLYMYIGGSSSGASTLVTAGPELSALTDSVARQVVDPGAVGVLVIASGGGSGGHNGCYGQCNPGRTVDDGRGGAGANCVANGNPPSHPVSNRGANGNPGWEGTGSGGGEGGNANGYGSAGANHGAAGIGGMGTGKWSEYFALIPPMSWVSGGGGAEDPGGDGGGGFGGGGGGKGSEGNGGGGGGCWAAANTTVDLSTPSESSPPASVNGTAGAVQLVYTKTKFPCPTGMRSASFDGGKISCVLTESAAVDVKSWLTELITEDYVTNSTPVRLAAWGGVGGAVHQTSTARGARGLASLTTTVGTLLNGGTLYAYIGSSGKPSATQGSPDGPQGGAASVVLQGRRIEQIEAAVADPATESVMLIAGGGGGNSETVSGGTGGRCTSTTSASCTAAGGSPKGTIRDDGTSCAGQGGAKGVGGHEGAKAGGVGKGTAGIGGFGGGGGHTLSTWKPGINGFSVPTSWSYGYGGTTGAPTPDGFYAGGGGGGGWGGGGAGGVHDAPWEDECPGGGGATWAARSNASSTYPTANTGSPGGTEGGFEIYVEVAQ